MRTTSLPILLAASAAFAFAAHAQAPPPATPAPSSDLPIVSQPPETAWDSWRGKDLIVANPIRDGVDALKNQDFAEAEKNFAKVLRYKPASADANFYMGVTGMNLGKWEDARKHLEIAVRKKPKHPDPKSRLGVTYAWLGDTAGANAQRAELVKMADACKGDCRLSPYITSGIQMIDEALAEAAVPNPG
jgi:TolA-binding protein